MRTNKDLVDLLVPALNWEAMKVAAGERNVDYVHNRIDGWTKDRPGLDASELKSVFRDILDREKQAL